MATVKILYDEDAKDMENYLKRKREVEGPTTEHLCLLEGMAGEFKALQHDRASKGNSSIHLIQSWSPAESKKLSREDIHAMGIELVSRFAPGHQYIIQTHTEKAHAHNHIVLNPVSIETGERIHNKLGHIRTLRNINDEIARSRGLSVLPTQDKLRLPGPSELSRRIEAYRGRSYIVDLAAKADFARHHATNYDEFIAVLNAFDINVRVEPKNITYFYPGRETGKRGRNLGPELDKPGLEARFKKNWERVQASPETKVALSELVAGYRRAPDALAQASPTANPLEARVSRRADGITQPDARALTESILPIEELRRAKAHSILAYCRHEKIALDRTEDGHFVLRGREYVEVSDFTWTNHKNKTRGGVIDFVANHRQVGFLQAVATLNDNPKLLLLEKHMGEAKRRYQSFYVPREDAAPRADAIHHLSRLLNLPTRHPVHSELFKRQMAHVTSQGVVFLFTGADNSAAAEYEPNTRGSYSLRRRVSAGRPFFVSRGSGADLRLYVDARTFLMSEPGALERGGKTSAAGAAIVALFEPDIKAAHQAIAGMPKVRRVRLQVAPTEARSPEIQKFHAELQASLNPFSIETSLAWEPVRETALSPNLDGTRDLGRGREIHHP